MHTYIRTCNASTHQRKQLRTNRIIYIPDSEPELLRCTWSDKKRRNTTFKHTNMHIHTYKYIHTFIHTYVDTYIHTCIHTYQSPWGVHCQTSNGETLHPHKYIHTYMHIQTNIYKQKYTYIHIYTYIHTCIHTAYQSPWDVRYQTSNGETICHPCSRWRDLCIHIIHWQMHSRITCSHESYFLTNHISMSTRGRPLQLPRPHYMP